MKTFFSLFLILISLISCQPTKTMTETSAYTTLPNKVDLEDYLHQSVAFKATLCSFEMQHMLRSSLGGDVQYICIDPKESYGIGQMLAYSSLADMYRKKYQNKEITVYGKIGKVSGAGKGGNTHTEYYLELEKVE